MNARNSTFGDALGAATVRARGGVLEFCHERHTSRSMLLRACEQATALMAAHGEIASVLFDLRDHTSHDPGNTAIAFRWFLEYRPRIARIALVTRSQALATFASLGRVMLPWIDTRRFVSYDEAHTWCSQRAPSGARGPHTRTRRNTAA
jgi:hypothetical protein